MQSNYFNRILNLKRERFRKMIVLSNINNSDSLLFSFRLFNSNSKIKSQDELEDLLRKKNNTHPTNANNERQNQTNKLIKKENIQNKFNQSKQQHQQRQQFYEQTQSIDHKKFQISEKERIKLLTPNFKLNQDSEEIDNKLSSSKLNEKKLDLIKSEKEFFQNASFNTCMSTLDEAGHELLNKFKFLSRSSVEPRHLTILHSNLAEKISSLIYERSFSNTDKNCIFFDFQPGASLITQSLVQKNQKQAKKSKFLLIESFSKYQPLQLELKQKHENEHNEIHLIHASPFNQEFLKKTFHLNKKITEVLKIGNETSKLVVFGIVPWNTKGYISILFGDYFFDRGVFHLCENNNLEPEFYFFMPEFLAARLNARKSPGPKSFPSMLHVHASIFAECEILLEERAEFFFPYPQLANPYHYNSYQYKNIDLKKLCLVRLRFKHKASIDDESVFKPERNRRLFYVFVMQLYSRPANRIKDVLASICFNAEGVCRLNGLNQYFKVKQIKPFQFYYLFMYLMKNPGLLKASSMEAALNPDSLLDIEVKRKKKTNGLKTLKLCNQTMSGQLIVPMDSRLENTQKIPVNKKENVGVEKNEAALKKDVIYDKDFDDNGWDSGDALEEDEELFYGKKSSVFIK